jgi:hypothetical protein
MGEGGGMRRARPQRPSAGHTPPSSSCPRQNERDLVHGYPAAPPASQLTQTGTGNAQ